MCDVMLDLTDGAQVAEHLECPGTLAPRRQEFSRHLVRAFEVVSDFAAGHGWQGCLKHGFVGSFQVFSTQEQMWRKLKALTDSSEPQPPTDGLSSALEFGCLLAVTPEEYRRLRPEYANMDEAWARLLAHEMAHQLHIRLVGHEDKMGPKWFYEGFAMYVAGQRMTSWHPSTREEVTHAMCEESRGAYAKYEAVFELFLERIDLRVLLKRASEADFQTWLIESVF